MTIPRLFPLPPPSTAGLQRLTTIRAPPLTPLLARSRQELDSDAAAVLQPRGRRRGVSPAQGNVPLKRALSHCRPVAQLHDCLVARGCTLSRSSKIRSQFVFSCAVRWWWAPRSPLPVLSCLEIPSAPVDSAPAHHGRHVPRCRLHTADGHRQLPSSSRRNCRRTAAKLARAHPLALVVTQPTTRPQRGIGCGGGRRCYRRSSNSEGFET